MLLSDCDQQISLTITTEIVMARKYKSEAVDHDSGAIARSSLFCTEKAALPTYDKSFSFLNKEKLINCVCVL